MSFHSSFEDEFLIDEFSLFIMKTSFSSQGVQDVHQQSISTQTIPIVATCIDIRSQYDP